ncbi:MAG: sn-glycerol-3-phosphate ABC transporter ATP-binding protein UgpC [Opitutaceae bacterium]|nr:sn-glycerol-3-phosphate ABC transporter ATP-binding protein UgpC [Opitutaceae bacterium]
MSRVVLEKLAKRYPEKQGPGVTAVDAIDLVVEDREFMVLVGPSGCGKSTTLRMIAGLEEISGGTVAIDGQIVNDVLPKDRDIAMVFQNYALYPHMSVYDNMAFGLKLRKLPKPEIDARVREAAAMLGLTDYLNRKPKALSGGQRQRVAVGRAIVRKPKVFLFDEPLSNLDAKMRVSMRSEISRLHARLGATMIYVTHDQMEAMTMGDRICVMKNGKIMQVAEPMEIYNRPANLFVAGFIGSPQMNFFRGTVRRADGHFQFVEHRSDHDGLTLNLGDHLAKTAADSIGNSVVLGIRPECIHDTLTITRPDPGQNAEVKIDISEPVGAETYLYLDSGATTFTARVKPADRYEAGQTIQVTFDLDQAHLFDAQTENILR